MLRQTVGHRAPPLLFPSFSPLTVTFPNLAVILRPQDNGLEWKIACDFSIDIVKNERLTCNRLPLVMKHVCATLKLEANTRARSGKNTLSLRSKKFSSVPYAGKVMLALFWDVNRPTL
jgi:hypothetical protein